MGEDEQYYDCTKDTKLVKQGPRGTNSVSYYLLIIRLIQKILKLLFILFVICFIIKSTLHMTYLFLYLH